MTWVRIDDGFAQHPKLMKVGPLGIALQVAGLCYCNRNQTDGFIPWAAANTLLAWEYLEPGAPFAEKRRRFQIAVTCGMAGDDCNSERVIELLVAAGIWEEVDGGYQIHDYADYQPTKAELEVERAKKQAAGKAGGTAAAIARAQANGIAKSKPVPVPVPDTKPNPAANKLAAVLADAQFLDGLRSRFASLDFDYELQKWQDHVDEKPPKSNYKNSLRNWLENAVKFAANGRDAGPADLSFFADRYERGKNLEARA